MYILIGVYEYIYILYVHIYILHHTLYLRALLVSFQLLPEENQAKVIWCHCSLFSLIIILLS